MKRARSIQNKIDQTLSVLSTIARVPFEAAESQQRFQQAAFKHSFFTLVQNYQPQVDAFSCGVASAVIVLNSIAGKASFTQKALLTKETDKIKHRKLVKQKNGGFTLEELAAIMRWHRCRVKVQYCDTKIKSAALNAFKSDLMRCLSGNEEFLVANFDSEKLIQSGSGHFSPLAAYDRISDSVLVMDTGRHRTPWHWVPIEHLYGAMQTKDGPSFRGYLLVKAQG